jgi:hypothetical protein
MRSLIICTLYHILLGIKPVMKWMRHVARMEEMKTACKILVGKLKGKVPLGRPKCMWEENITIGLKETGYEVWAGFIWLRIGHSARFRKSSENLLTSWATISFSRWALLHIASGIRNHDPNV